MEKPIEYWCIEYWQRSEFDPPGPIPVWCSKASQLNYNARGQPASRCLLTGLDPGKMSQEKCADRPSAPCRLTAKARPLLTGWGMPNPVTLAMPLV